MRLALLGAVFLLFRLVSALYEEQAGFLDWHKENVGSVKYAHFAPRGRERVFVATEAAVIASLDTKDGSIVWRQVFGEGDNIDALLLVPRPACVLSLSQNGTTLRAWNAMDGTLLWQKLVSPSAAESETVVTVLPDVTGDGSSDIFFASGQKAQVLSAPKGRVVWSKALSGTVLAASPVAGSGSAAIAIAVAEEGSLQMTRIEAATGSEIDRTTLSPSAGQVILSEQYALSSADGKLCALKYGGSPICKPAASLDSALDASAKLGVFLSQDAVALHTADRTVVAALSPTGIVPIPYTGKTAGSSVQETSEKGVLAGVSSSGSLEILIVDSSGNPSGKPWQIAANLLTVSRQPVKVKYIIAGSRRVGEFRKADKTVNRFLVVAEDDTVLLVEEGKMFWRREEGLARVQSTLFLDLPAAAADMEADYKAMRPSLMDRVNAEVLTVKKSLGIAQPEEEAVLKDINARLSSHLLPHKDSNGFRKLILLLSASGKVFGLHSGDGRILWSATLDKEIPLSRLFLSASSHDPQISPQALLLGSSNGKSSYVVINAHTGQVLEQNSLPGTVEKVIPQGHIVREGRLDYHSFALVLSDSTVKALPPSTSLTGPIYFWKHLKEQGVIAGYKVAAGAQKAVEQWSTAFAGSGNSILSVVARDPEESVYSYAKVLGNRSMKLKYLNPNAIFVASGVQDTGAKALLGEATLTVQLIDTISGQIIYQQTLEGAKGPVEAVLSENWVVYSYYSTVNQRFEIAVLEFYDVQPRDLSIPSLLLGNQSTTLSAFSPTPIEVLHQSYFTPVSIKAMAVTTTRKGITSKQLLLGTQANQVYLMDKRFLDPRRPKGTLTADEKLEMLPPYAEELPFTPSLYASHKEAVEGLKGIVASPANLESTTLTLSYGLDLFFARVQPSKTFDLLPDDFPFAMLVMVTAALLVGAFVLKRMEDNSAVKRKWS